MDLWRDTIKHSPRSCYSEVKQGNGCDCKTALNWALNARKLTAQSSWLQPIATSVRAEPYLPSVLVDKPPALEGTSVGAWGWDSTFQHYMQREKRPPKQCSERIRRALRKPLRPTDEKYETGNKEAPLSGYITQDC